MNITRLEIEQARTCDLALRNALEWWAWNDPNGLWQEALDHLDGVSEYDNPEGWNPLTCRGDLVDSWLESLDYYFQENEANP